MAAMSQNVPPPASPKHVDWLIPTGYEFATSCGTKVPVYELQYVNDAAILSEWAAHFRNHYCEDGQIDALCAGTGLSKSEYLLQHKFPNASEGFGPATRAGDFAEILISDYVAFLLNYMVPRLRYRAKWIPNESTKGADVVGFKFDGRNASRDELITYEVKSLLPPNQNKTLERLQFAIDDSAKDQIRLGLSLNAFKQMALDRIDMPEVDRIARFQNISDNPFVRRYGAALVVDDTSFDHSEVGKTSAAQHPFRTALSIVVIRGRDLRDLAHHLYARAAAEA